MMTLDQFRRVLDEDLTTYQRDILEFNHKQIAKGAIGRIEQSEQEHARQMQQLRNLLDVGAIVTTLMADARRTGRETVKIADILDVAEKRVLEIREAAKEAA